MLKRRILLRQQRHPSLKVCVGALRVEFKHLMSTNLEKPLEIMFQYLSDNITILPLHCIVD